MSLPKHPRVAFAPYLIAAFLVHGCSQKAAPPTERIAPSATASEGPISLLQWAADEPVALVHARDAVIARAVESGRSRVLWAGLATWVTHDAALDLVWVQGNDTLDVIDLRATAHDIIPIAKGLPTAVPITITRTSEGGTHVSASPPECDSGRSLVLDWKTPSRVRFLDGQSAGFADPPGATLPGSPWLQAQLARRPRGARAARRSFPVDSSPAGGPFAARRPKCAAESCGKPIPFDGRGLQIVVTSFEQGDCQHWGCHLYDPATHTFATPPTAAAWGRIDDAPAGSCGPYRFDRSGKRFLVDTSLCDVGGTCQDLSGAAVGWIQGGVEVGMNG